MVNYNRTPSSLKKDGSEGRILANQIYVGIVKDNKDVEGMGRLRVWIPEFGGKPGNPDSWITVSYASPFAGATNAVENVIGGKQQNQTQLSYGFWMVPPDLENYVLVCFAGGDLIRGYWFACLYQQNMNHMVPGIPLNVSTQDGINSQILPPVSEYNKRDEGIDVRDPKRPKYEPLHFGLDIQGLYSDPERGPSTTGARRGRPERSGQTSSPGDVARVYGFLTPGGNTINIDEDPDNEFIRLRTKTGVQIVLHETTGYIYMNSKLGNSWFELSDEGINFYTAGNFNVRAEGSINMHADNNIQLNAVKAFHAHAENATLKAENRYTTHSGSNTVRIADTVILDNPNNESGAPHFEFIIEDPEGDAIGQGGGGAGEGGGGSGSGSGAGDGGTGNGTGGGDGTDIGPPEPLPPIGERTISIECGGRPRSAQFTGAPWSVDPATGDCVGYQTSEINDVVAGSVERVLGPDARVVMTSGLRVDDRTSPGSQHRSGGAMDFYVLRPDGSRLQWDDPETRQIFGAAVDLGAKGLGAGPNYMSGNTFHVDMGTGGGGSRPRNGVMTWSDTGRRSQSDPGAAQWRELRTGGTRSFVRDPVNGVRIVPNFIARDSNKESKQGFMPPVSHGYIKTPFGITQKNKRLQMISGVFLQSLDENVRVSKEGFIKSVKRTKKHFVIEVQHEDDYTTKYIEVYEVFVKKEQKVQTGEIIGKSPSFVYSVLLNNLIIDPNDVHDDMLAYNRTLFTTKIKYNHDDIIFDNEKVSKLLEHSQPVTIIWKGDLVILRDKSVWRFVEKVNGKFKLRQGNKEKIVLPNKINGVRRINMDFDEWLKICDIKWVENDYPKSAIIDSKMYGFEKTTAQEIIYKMRQQGFSQVQIAGVLGALSGKDFEIDYNKDFSELKKCSTIHQSIKVATEIFETTRNYVIDRAAGVAALGHVSSSSTPPSNVRYSNQGAIRNQPLSPRLLQSMETLEPLGLGFEVTSGGQPAIGTVPNSRRVGSTRHDLGNAADGYFYDLNTGQRLSWANPAHVPRLQTGVAQLVNSGVTGVGAGPGYMAEGMFHVGFGTPAVWGRNGSGSTAPQWLRDAYETGSSSSFNPFSGSGGSGTAQEFAGAGQAFTGAAGPFSPTTSIPEARGGNLAPSSVDQALSRSTMPPGRRPHPDYGVQRDAYKPTVTDSVTVIMPTHEPWIGHPQRKLPDRTGMSGSSSQYGGSASGSFNGNQDMSLNGPSTNGGSSAGSSGGGGTSSASNNGPLPATNLTTQADVKDEIVAASERYGLPPDHMLAIAHIETGGRFNADAQNPVSSAGGIFQFLDGTWAEYGNGAHKYDAKANIDAGMRFTINNRDRFVRDYGRQPTAGDLYMMHQQGYGGARKIFNARNRNPNQNACSALGRAEVTKNGGNCNMTITQFGDIWNNKANRLAESYSQTRQQSSPSTTDIERGDPAQRLS